MVSDIAASGRYYGDALGFEMTKQWVPEGRLRWCWLQSGGAALMLQEFAKAGHGRNWQSGAAPWPLNEMRYCGSWCMA